MPASVCRAYDCSVCYVQCEASPERLAAPGTAGGNHPSGKGGTSAWNFSLICHIKIHMMEELEPRCFQF